MRASEDEPPARQELLALDERLDSARAHDARQRPAGKRDGEVVRAGREHEAARREPGDAVGTGERDLDSGVVGVRTRPTRTSRGPS